ncbi:MAG: hypothetical protein WAM85_04095 [Terracidiphilus sp.]
MKRVFRAIFPAAFLLLAMGAKPQVMRSDHWSPAELLERAQHLRQLAAQGDGSASEILEKYPHHYTMLAFRNRTGGGELHKNFADLFYILDGHTTLITGGEVVDPTTSGPGEIRGTSVKGGTAQELKAGDVVHIPAGMAHQMRVGDGDTVTYFVVKIQENQ